MSRLVLDNLRLRRRLVVTARLVFDTAWRIGTGKEGTTMSDLGVLLDPAGRPVLPGSSIKGKLRGTCEALAHALGLSACLLDIAASGVECASDVDYFSRARGEHQAAVRDGLQAQLAWIEKHTCDVCKLFGSPVRAAQLRCADGVLENPASAAVQVRDGVVLDRDSHTAVSGLKYDYEVLPAGTAFRVRFDLDNPAEVDTALFGAALFDWAAGSSLGGFTSRGLGRFRLEEIRLRGADLDDPKQRARYLTSPDPEQRLSDLGDWEAYFNAAIGAHLEAKS
jgi:CRISPR-associated RAMP protein (TIGR02581 family)